MKKGPVPVPLIERLMRRVQISADGCWIWTGVISRNGYGRIGEGGKYGRQLSTHRVSYAPFAGTIPDGLTIDHLCRNRRCVNPGHLEAVTIRENVLRGMTFAARKAQQTHCVNGHEFTEDNTARRPNGTRGCRICQRARKKAAA